MSIQTKLEGEPAAITDASRWLQGRFASEAMSAGDVVVKQRGRLASDWQGSAGEAFGARAATLGRAADGVAAVAREGGAALGTLAGALRTAKQALAEVRSEAAGAGLTVAGTVIEEPKPVPVPSLVPTDQLDGAGRSAQAHAVERFQEYQEQVKAYRKAAKDAREAFDDWDKALTRAVSDWSGDGAKLAVKVAGLMVTAANGATRMRLAPRLARQADDMMDLARSMRRTMDDMVDGRLPFSQSAYDRLLSGSRNAQRFADDALDASRFPELPKGLKLAGHSVNALSLGFGIYDDLRSGESPEQAVASNAAGTGAGILAGTAAGGAIGSAFGPGPGTIGGALIGTGVGLATNEAVDEFGDDIVDGVTDTASDIVEDLKYIGGPLP